MGRGRGTEIVILVGGLYYLGGHVILKLKLTLHNISIKSIFGITDLIYSRDIWKMHVSSEKISFPMVICRKCLEHCVGFSVDLFLKHLIFSPAPFSWNSRVWSFFSSILGIESFLEGFKVFCITHKKIEKYDGKNMKHISLMYSFNFFRNQLWQDWISYNSFKNVNMCLLEEAMYEKCRSGHF